MRGPAAPRLPSGAEQNRETKSVVSSERHRRLLAEVIEDLFEALDVACLARSTLPSSTARPFWCGLITPPILTACARAKGKQRRSWWPMTFALAPIDVLSRSAGASGNGPSAVSNRNSEISPALTSQRASTRVRTSPSPAPAGEGRGHVGGVSL